MSDNDSAAVIVLLLIMCLACLWGGIWRGHKSGHQQGLKDAAIGTWVAEMDPHTGEWSYRKVEEPEVEEPAHAD